MLGAIRVGLYLRSGVEESCLECCPLLGVIDVEAKGLNFEVVAVHHPREVAEIPTKQAL